MSRFRWLLTFAILVTGIVTVGAQTPSSAVSTPKAPNVTTGSFSNAPTNATSAATPPGLFTRLYRAVWGPETSGGTNRVSSYSYPAGTGQTNNLKMLGPKLPVMGTTTSFPIPAPVGLGPVLPKNATVNK